VPVNSSDVLTILHGCDQVIVTPEFAVASNASVQVQIFIPSLLSSSVFLLLRFLTFVSPVIFSSCQFVRQSPTVLLIRISN
jgi:hypothetical protein